MRLLEPLLVALLGAIVALAVVAAVSAVVARVAPPQASVLIDDDYSLTGGE